MIWTRIRIGLNFISIW